MPRSNILVIADEAHRSQYVFIDGFPSAASRNRIRAKVFSYSLRPRFFFAGINPRGNARFFLIAARISRTGICKGAGGFIREIREIRSSILLGCNWPRFGPPAAKTGPPEKKSVDKN
jgi:hypothetical protein